MTDTERLRRDELLAEAKAVAVSRENVQDLMDRYIEGTATNGEIIAVFQFLVDNAILWQQDPIIQSAAAMILTTDLVTKPENDNA